MVRYNLREGPPFELQLTNNKNTTTIYHQPSSSSSSPSRSRWTTWNVFKEMYPLFKTSLKLLKITTMVSIGFDFRKINGQRNIWRTPSLLLIHSLVTEELLLVTTTVFSNYTGRHHSPGLVLSGWLVSRNSQEMSQGVVNYAMAPIVFPEFGYGKEVRKCFTEWW